MNVQENLLIREYYGTILAYKNTLEAFYISYHFEKFVYVFPAAKLPQP